MKGPLVVSTSGVYRVTITVRNTSQAGYADAELKIAATDKGGPVVLAHERSGSQGPGIHWLFVTAVVFLEADEQLTGNLTVVGTNDLATDRGWFVIEKLTP
jgi:hypothetical protein